MEASIYTIITSITALENGLFVHFGAAFLSISEASKKRWCLRGEIYYAASHSNIGWPIRTVNITEKNKREAINILGSQLIKIEALALFCSAFQVFSSI